MESSERTFSPRNMAGRGGATYGRSSCRAIHHARIRSGMMIIRTAHLGIDQRHSCQGLEILQDFEAAPWGGVQESCHGTSLAMPSNHNGPRPDVRTQSI